MRRTFNVLSECITIADFPSNCSYEGGSILKVQAFAISMAYAQHLGVTCIYWYV
jgi:hypothetical protein